MTAVLIWGVISGAVAFAIHLAVWRYRVPRRPLWVIAAIFVSVLGGACLLQGFLPAGTVPAFGGGAAWVAFWLLGISWTLAYIITYTAIEVDSPTLVIMELIREAGPDGLRPDALNDFASDDRLVVPRLNDLPRMGMAISSNGVYHITPKGRRLIALFDTYRRILGRQKGG